MLHIENTGLIQMRPGIILEGLKDLIRYVTTALNRDDLTMIEIGCFAGESTMLFAEKFKVTAIDPYENGYDDKDAASSSDLERVYSIFLDNIKGKNVTHLRTTSDDAVGYLTEPVDLVYIDGIHTYDQVKKDISNYRHLVKLGGFISGHDYSGAWPGVVDAVNESFGRPLYIFRDSSWIVQL